MAELVDALASGASVSDDVEVQVLSSAPYGVLAHLVERFAGSEEVSGSNPLYSTISLFMRGYSSVD